MKLSVLDQSPIREGIEPAASIRETLTLASHCEALGYERFWVSEHHNSPSVAGTAPEVLMAALAARTSRIRIGSAGIMLPHYASLKVAECFRGRDALAPGRCELGLGRAPGSDMATAYALNPRVGENAENFPLHVQEVQALLAGHALGTASGGSIVAEPTGTTSPSVWILGSSTGGAQIAAYLGLPYCFAYFFGDGLGAEEALALYRERFRPSAALEAWQLDRDRGRYGPLSPPEAFGARVLTPTEESRVASMRAHAIVGTGHTVVAGLARLADGLGAAEVAVVTATFDPAIRRRSYALIAAAAGCAPSAS